MSRQIQKLYNRIEQKGAWYVMIIFFSTENRVYCIQFQITNKMSHKIGDSYNTEVDQ